MGYILFKFSQASLCNPTPVSKFIGTNLILSSTPALPGMEEPSGDVKVGLTKLCLQFRASAAVHCIFFVETEWFILRSVFLCGIFLVGHISVEEKVN